jgi:hypothetical protein
MWVRYYTVAEFSITRLGASDNGHSLDTSQAEHVTAKGLIEISGSPASTGLLHCTTL